MASYVTVSAEGSLLASASIDGTARPWDVEAGRCLAALAHLPEGWVAFTPDGRYRYGGEVGGGFWHAINLCRFEIGELDSYLPTPLLFPEDELLVPWMAKH